jgi:hypothetical protein
LQNGPPKGFTLCSTKKNTKRREGSGVKIEFMFFLSLNLEEINFIDLKDRKNIFFSFLLIKSYEINNKLNFSSPPLPSSFLLYPPLIAHLYRSN